MHSEETRKKIGDANRGEHKIVKCLNCCEEIDVPVRRRRRYCSHSCALSYRNRVSNPMKNKKARMRMAHSQKKRLSNKKNHPMFNRKHKTSSKKVMREKRLAHILPFKDTKIEIALQRGFKKEGIRFVKHINIMNITQPDIFIEPNLCIYADGDYWHGDDFPGTQTRDRRIARKLRKNAYSVFRFKEHDIKKNVDTCVRRVKNHLYKFKEYYLSSLI